ncbi:MAG: amidohydrolase [Gammaproteobacteria bacterium]
MELLQQAQELQQWAVQHRRHLHQYPELSLKEHKTSDYCQEVLKSLGYTIQTSWGCGFTADLKKSGNSKTIAWRADMDALPMQEKNQHEFVSKNTGIAHMCGHDTHMVIALTVAKLLIENKAQLKHNVRFLFQPSEEKAPGGALGMIEQGCLEGVDEVYGLHNDPGTEVGKIRTRVGALMAAPDMFSVTIVGKGCHAARPQDGLDPVVAGALLVTQWQSIISRRIDPISSAVLSVTQFHAGDTDNVIADHAKLSGTVRTFNEADREQIESLMQHSLSAIEQLGYRCEFNYLRGYDVVVNEHYGVERIKTVASRVLTASDIDIQTPPAAWAEDFCYYLQHRPGAFFFLGSGNVAEGISAPLHSSRFDIDERALVLGAAIVANLFVN